MEKDHWPLRVIAPALLVFAIPLTIDGAHEHFTVTSVSDEAAAVWGDSLVPGAKARRDIEIMLAGLGVIGVGACGLLSARAANRERDAGSQQRPTPN